MTEKSSKIDIRTTLSQKYFPPELLRAETQRQRKKPLQETLNILEKLTKMEAEAPKEGEEQEEKQQGT